MSGLLLYCRAGFESECAADIQYQISTLGMAGYCKAKPDSGIVLFQTHNADDATLVTQKLALRSLIFARQWFLVLALRNDLPITDRVSALLESASLLPAPVEALFLETPDTNSGKQLQRLCRAIAGPLKSALRKKGLWFEGSGEGLRLHVCFLSSAAAYVGYASVENSSAWPMGIPRLKHPRDAPSRSTLKLEEAILHFLDKKERQQLFQSGMRAVDLGASPGGWTWQLVRRGLMVVAVDNGPMDKALMESGQVEHLRVDGFRYRPARAVDWMVCDIVEQPARIAELAARWLESGWCRHTIFNLKLPMKKRYQEVRRCSALIQERLAGAGIAYRLSIKQLYHDREEVTVFVSRDR